MNGVLWQYWGQVCDLVHCLFTAVATTTLFHIYHTMHSKPYSTLQTTIILRATACPARWVLYIPDGDDYSTHRLQQLPVV